MLIVLLIMCLAFTELNAFIDAPEIKAGKVINHTLEYLIFLLVCLLTTYGLIYSFHITFKPLIWAHVDWSIFYPVCIALGVSTVTREAFFNFSLNYLRGFPLSYQSNVTTSIVDQIEQAILKAISNFISKVFSIPTFIIYDWYISVFFIAIYIGLFFVKI